MQYTKSVLLHFEICYIYNMNTQSIKLDLIRWLAALDDIKIIQQVLSLKEANSGSERTANHILPGEPMSMEELQARIVAAQTSVRNGNFTTMEDLEQEMKEW